MRDGIEYGGFGLQELNGSLLLARSESRSTHTTGEIKEVVDGSKIIRDGCRCASYSGWLLGRLFEPLPSREVRCIRSVGSSCLWEKGC